MVPSRQLLISMPSAPSVISTFSAWALLMRFSPTAASPDSKIVQGQTGFAFRRGEQRHVLVTGNVADLRRGLAVGSQHHAGRARLCGDRIDEVLRQAAVVEAGKQDQIACGQASASTAASISALNVRACRVMTQVIDPQQGFVQRPEALLSGGRPGAVGKEVDSARPVPQANRARILRPRLLRQSCR